MMIRAKLFMDYPAEYCECGGSVTIIKTQRNHPLARPIHIGHQLSEQYSCEDRIKQSRLPQKGHTELGGPDCRGYYQQYLPREVRCRLYTILENGYS